MTRRELIGASVTLPLFALPVHATEPDSLGWLLGEWAGEGSFFGRPGTARLTAARQLAGRFLELRWSVSSGSRQYEGRGLYRLGTGAMDGHWYDVTGAIRPLTATLGPDSLRAEWRGPEPGYSRYRRDGGVLVVEDRVAAAAGDRLFAAHRLIRES